ncbi:MAG: hypothetical protein KAI02_07040 [Gammaproteobacteria bacterium]|nr:hypothetical protein [Gammaproteobacteria bacterium]
MKTILQHIALLTVILLATGCANQSELQLQLQDQVNTLNAQVNSLSAQVAKINDHSNEANQRSQEALNSAHRAEQTAEHANSKLDRMFKKSMMK